MYLNGVLEGELFLTLLSVILWLKDTAFSREWRNLLQIIEITPRNHLWFILTSPEVQSPFKKELVSRVIKKFYTFMESEKSLPCSQHSGYMPLPCAWGQFIKIILPNINVQVQTLCTPWRRMGEGRYSSIPALLELSNKVRASAALPLVKIERYPLSRQIREPQLSTRTETNAHYWCPKYCPK